MSEPRVLQVRRRSVAVCAAVLVVPLGAVAIGSSTASAASIPAVRPILDPGDDHSGGFDLPPKLEEWMSQHGIPLNALSQLQAQACHATSSETNPYVIGPANIVALVAAGHFEHPGDMIRVVYEGSLGAAVYTTANWNQAVYDNGCKPVTPPDPDPEPTLIDPPTALAPVCGPNNDPTPPATAQYTRGDTTWQGNTGTTIYTAVAPGRFKPGAGVSPDGKTFTLSTTDQNVPCQDTPPTTPPVSPPYTPPPVVTPPITPKPTTPVVVRRFTETRVDCKESGVMSREGREMSDSSRPEYGPWVKVEGLSAKELRAAGCIVPTPVKLERRTYQVDRLMPRTAAQARVVARLDDDSRLEYREDRPLWGASRYQFVTITVPKTATASQVIAAINLQLRPGIGKLTTTRRLSSARAGQHYVLAWQLGKGASVKEPWGARNNVPQGFVARG